MLPGAAVALVAVAAVAIAATSGGGALIGGEAPLAVPDKSAAASTSTAPPSAPIDALAAPTSPPPVAIAPPPAAIPTPGAATVLPPLPLAPPALVVQPVPEAPTHSAPPPPGRASAPRGVTASAGNAFAVVRWRQPADDGGSAVRRYVVTVHPGRTRHTSTATTLTLRRLTNGRSYAFTVRAVTSVGEGAESPASSPVVPATVPARVSGVAAVDSDRAATVTWRPPADGGAQIYKYEVVASPGGQRVQVGGTRAVISGLTNGTAYRFAVRAFNRVGAGPVSTASSPVTPAGLPGAPSAVTASPGDGTVRLSWQPADGNGAPVQSYIVTVLPGGRQVSMDPSGTVGSHVVISALTNGTRYGFVVQARNRVGTGGKSPSSNLVTPKWVTRLSIARSASLVRYGSSVVVTGRLTKVRDGGGLGGATVTLLRRKAGTTTYAKVASATTSSTGVVRFTHTPGWTVAYRLSFAGNGVAIAKGSVATAVRVRPVVHLRNATTIRVRAGYLYTVYGYVAPNHTGRRVYLQRKVNGVWKTSTSMVLGGLSDFKFKQKRARGTYYLRVYIPAHADHVGAVSSTIKVIVS